MARRDRRLGIFLVATVAISSAIGPLHAGSSVEQQHSGRELIRHQGWASLEHHQRMREQARSLMEWGLYARAARAFEMAGAVLLRKHGLAHPETMRNRAELADVLLRQGKPEGEKMLSDLYAWQQASLVEKHPELLRTRHFRAKLMIARGQHDEAEAELKTVNKLREQTLGPAHPDTLASQEELAQLYHKIYNFVAEEEQLKLVLSSDASTFGLMSPQTLANRRKLGECLQNQSKFDEALAEFNAVVTIVKEAFGSHHPLLFKARQQLANVLYHQGKHEEAERGFRKLVDTMAKIAGPESWETLRLRGEVVECLVAQGRLAEAEREMRSILSLGVRLEGPDSEQMQSWREQLTPILLEMNQVEEAEKLIRGVLDYRMKVFGKEHPSTLKTWFVLTTCYVEKGNLLLAEADIRAILETRERVMGQQDPTTWYTRVHLADVLRKAGKPAEALPLFQGAAAYYGAMVGPLHPQTLKQVNNLSVTLSAVGRTEEGAALQETLLARRAEVFGWDHPDTIKSRINVGVNLREQGKMRDAEKLLQDVIVSAERALGASHALTVGARFNLVEILCDDRRPAEAEAVARAGLQVSLAANSPGREVRGFRTGIAMCLVQQNRGGEKEAVEIAAEAEKVVAAEEGYNPEETLALSNMVAWVKMASGREADALAQVDKSLALLTRHKLSADHSLVLRVKCMHAVALRLLGKDEQSQKVLAEVGPLLGKAFRDGEPILQLSAHLSRKAPPSLPVVTHALLCSRARPIQQTPQGDAAHLLGVDISPDQHAELMRIYEESQVLEGQGMNDKALEKAEKFAIRASEIFGGDKPNLVEAYLFVSKTAVLGNRPEKSREYARKAVLMMKGKPKEQYGPFEEGLRKTINSFAAVGNSIKARDLVAHVVEACDEVMGETDALTLIARSNAVELSVFAKAPEAGELLKQHVASLEEHLGPDDAKTVQLKLLQLHWQLDNREFGAAHKLAFGLEEVVKRLFGEDSRQNLLVREAGAAAFEGQGLRKMAVSEMRMVLADAERISGEEALETVMVRLRFALMLQRDNAIQEALDLHHRNLKILQNPATAKHPVLAETRAHLASLLMAMRRVDEALEHARQAVKEAKAAFGAESETTRFAESILEAIRGYTGRK